MIAYQIDVSADLLQGETDHKWNVHEDKIVQKQEKVVHKQNAVYGCSF